MGRPEQVEHGRQQCRRSAACAGNLPYVHEGSSLQHSTASASSSLAAAAEYDIIRCDIYSVLKC